jgi:hypothetical protein
MLVNGQLESAGRRAVTGTSGAPCSCRSGLPPTLVGRAVAARLAVNNAAVAVTADSLRADPDPGPALPAPAGRGLTGALAPEAWTVPGPCSACYMALGSREPPWTDAKQIVRRGGIDRHPGRAEHPRHTSAWCATVRTYAIYSAVADAGHLPGGDAGMGRRPGRSRRRQPGAPARRHLWPRLHRGALLCLLFLQPVLDRGRQSPGWPPPGRWRWGTTTLVMVYARSPYSEIHPGGLLPRVTSLWLLRLMPDTPAGGRRSCWGSGFGLLVNTKAPSTVLAVPGGGAVGGADGWAGG